MGFRFRKSIGNKFFRATISKSGISYSAGVPGMRVTKLANGKTRQTSFIPGTGISYVKDYSNNSPIMQKTDKARPCDYMLFGFVPTWIIDKNHYITSLTSKPIKSINKNAMRVFKWIFMIPIELCFWIGSVTIFSPMWYVGIMMLASAITMRNLRLSFNGLLKIMDNLK